MSAFDVLTPEFFMSKYGTAWPPLSSWLTEEETSQCSSWLPAASVKSKVTGHIHSVEHKKLLEIVRYLRKHCLQLPSADKLQVRTRGKRTQAERQSCKELEPHKTALDNIVTCPLALDICPCKHCDSS